MENNKQIELSDKDIGKLLDLALKEIYWNKNKEFFGERFSTRSFLSDFFYTIKNLVDNPVSEEQIKQAFLILDSRIFFEAIEWGFDSSVRESLNEFIEKNREEFDKILSKE